MSTNTTDNSTIQSDELEDIQQMIMNKEIECDEAIEMITEFAERKIKLQISKESLYEKIDQIVESIELEKL